MASPLGQLQTFGFGLSVLLTTLPSWFIAKSGVFWISFLPKDKQEVARALFARLVYRCMGIGWYCTTLFTPWVRVRREGFESLNEGFKKTRGKPRLMLMNHASFMDSLISLGCMPLVDIADLKTMAASHLFKMPIISALCQGCNHLPVVFKSGKDGDFGVDKEKTADIQEKLEAHVRAGGIGAWYPEGAMNPGDPTKLQTFRAGGFGIATKIDCEVWCMCMAGQESCWPRKASMGGKASNIGIKAFKLCDSTFALAEAAAVTSGTEPSRAKALYIAQYAQEKMQAELDTMYAAGWVSGPSAAISSGEGSEKKNS